MAAVVQSPPSALNVDPAAEDLFHRVVDWHTLDYSKFGALKLHSPLEVSRDFQTWRKVEGFLFSDIVIMARGEKGSQWKLQGSILLKHIKVVKQETGEVQILTLELAVQEVPKIHVRFANQGQLEEWKRGMK